MATSASETRICIIHCDVVKGESEYAHHLLRPNITTRRHQAEHRDMSQMAAHLVRLCDIREDNINHADQHPVPCRVPGILNNGDHIGPLLGHIDKVPSTPVRELNSIDQPFLQK